MNQSKTMLTTEAPSRYNDLEKMEIIDILKSINQEDTSVPVAVASTIPQIERLVREVSRKMKDGGRLFYVGAGTSGRLGILDASEIPPTYGASPELIVGIIAGGETAIRSAVEGAEDDTTQCFRDLQDYNICMKDTVVGIAASGTTPYVLGGLRAANKLGILTACITCNSNSPITEIAKIPMVAEVGPEVVTGSTRMKAGTAQKLILNMISSTVMIKLGKVKGNKMVDMQLSNKKLVNRAIKMIADELQVNKDEAEQLMITHGSVRQAIENYTI